jgi:predicted transcriptional regulator
MSTRKRKTRTTSVEVYKELVKKGVLPTMRREIYAWLYTNGPATRNEIALAVHMIPNNCSTRLKEMIGLGIVAERGEDKCQITGRNVILYDVTANMPRKDNGTSRPRAHIHTPRNCGECPLVVEEEGDDVCWMNLTVRACYDHRPVSCELNKRDFVIRGR